MLLFIFDAKINVWSRACLRISKLQILRLLWHFENTVARFEIWLQKIFLTVLFWCSRNINGQMQRFFAKVQNIDVLRVSEEMISKKIFGTCHKLWQAIKRWFSLCDFFLLHFSLCFTFPEFYLVCPFFTLIYFCNCL